MINQVPASVASNKACPICWRPFGGGTIYSQTLDGVSRLICSSCGTLFFPQKLWGAEKPANLPEGYEDASIIHLDVSEMQAASDRERLTKAIRGEVPDDLG